MLGCVMDAWLDGGSGTAGNTHTYMHDAKLSGREKGGSANNVFGFFFGSLISIFLVCFLCFCVYVRILSNVISILSYMFTSLSYGFLFPFSSFFLYLMIVRIIGVDFLFLSLSLSHAQTYTFSLSLRMHVVM